MSKFYGTVSGGARTEATRRGFDSIKVSAQSWDGSLITRMWYGHEGQLLVDLSVYDGSSSCYGTTIFSGTLDELKDKLMDKPGAFERRLIEETQKKVRINEEYERTLFEAYEATSIMLALQEDGKLTADEMFSRVRELDKKLGKIWG